MATYFRPGTLDASLLARKLSGMRPERYTETGAIQDLLREGLAHDPSDIHIVSGHPVLLEVNGDMVRITDHVLEWVEFENIARVLRDKEGATVVLSQGGDYDDAFTMMDIHGKKRRLRVNMSAITSLRSKQAAHLVLRPLQDIPPSVEELGIPTELLERCFPSRGAVYVIGPTGSGKTTLFASLIRHAAETGCGGHGHLATYESPPEFDLEGLSSKHLLITQVAIGATWGLPTFAYGGRNAMRRHPCMIMIGEVRDYETVLACVEACLTGHPVQATTHADNPALAFQRLVTRYPAEQQRAGLYDLIMTTEVIVAQRLVKARAGGRVAIREWVAFDTQMRRKLLSLPDAPAVIAAIQDMVEAGGHSFSQSAKEMVASGTITEEVGLQFFR